MPVGTDSQNYHVNGESYILSFLLLSSLFLNEFVDVADTISGVNYGTPMVAKFDSLFLVDAENIYSIYCKFYSII